MEKKMAVYWSTKINAGNGHQPVYREKDGVLSTLSPEPSQGLCNHSPSGFNYSYGGSGPSQLALALLYDVTGNKVVSYRYHQNFKQEFVASWADEWEITSDEILDWLRKQGDIL